MTPPMSSDDQDALRALVRQVLRDAMPDEVGHEAPTPTSEAVVGGGAAESVVLRSDADLQTFVGRLLTLFENPKRRDDLRTGRLRFTLASASVPGQPQPARRIERGAVTESQVKDAARVGASLVLGPRAVLTPLAKDRARALGVTVEKES